MNTTRTLTTAAPWPRRSLIWLRRHWLGALTVILGLYAGLPWLAPIFMQLGWVRPAEWIYLLYSTQCHQLPERSFFLFGPRPMLSLQEVQDVWRSTLNPFILRQFIGNPEVGWKVAWSDRMVALYTSLFVSSVVVRFLRRGLRPLPIWAAVLLALPMVLDGGTHFVSDLAGLGQGFRDTNAWLAALTGNVLPAAFYAGDALGSFNSWMRLITGALFGISIGFWALPYLESLSRAAHPGAATVSRS